MPTRRQFLYSAATLALPRLDDFPTTGTQHPAFRAFDEMIVEHMRERGLPGGSVAVMRNGKLAHARGYGIADRGTGEPVQPTSLFRLASVSKPITGTAIMTLVEDPKYHLDLEMKAFRFLGREPFLTSGRAVDPRIWDITLRNLLNHAGGWDRGKSGDIMFKHFQVAREMGIASPPDHASLIRWAMGHPLDFAPGQRYAYSNFGFCVLGRIIEKVSGMRYEQYVREKVLAPAGITTMRIGKGHRAEHFPGEAAYYTPGDRKTRSVFSADGAAPVPAAYGFASPETMDAHGGWVASAVDLMRFAAALDGTGKRQILTRESLKTMYARPAPPLGVDPGGNPEPAYYALGWNVRPNRGGANYWHMGGMPGTSTLFVRMSSGNSWALLFNRDDAGNIDALMHRAIATVKGWPDHDLFATYA